MTSPTRPENSKTPTENKLEKPIFDRSDPKITYTVILQWADDKSPVYGFKAIVQEWGGSASESPPEWKKFTESEDGSSLTFELSKFGKTAKMTLIGPISGIEGAPINFETYIRLGSKYGGKIVVNFERCPDATVQATMGISVVLTAHHASEAAALDAARSSDALADFGQLGTENDDTVKKLMDDITNAKLNQFGIGNNGQPTIELIDWQTETFLRCATLRVWMADPAAENLDYYIRLRDAGANEPYEAYKLLSQLQENPTNLSARTRQGKTFIEITDDPNAPDPKFRFAYKVLNDPIQNILVLPFHIQAEPIAAGRHFAFVPMDDLSVEKLVDYNGNWAESSVLAQAKKHKDLRHYATQKGLAWIASNHRGAKNPQVLAFFYSQHQKYFLLLDHGANLQNTNAYEWIFDKQTNGPMITQDLQLDEILVSWEG